GCKLLFFAVALLAGVCAQTENMDMFGLINLLYWKADQNRDGVVSPDELADIWHGFDQNNDSDVTLAEFAPLWQELTGMGDELTRAYFYLTDLDDNGKIDGNDLPAVYGRFDLNGDGSVAAEEFNLKWQMLYREAPFGVLYLRADTNKDDDLTRDEFAHLFSSLSNNTDGSVTRQEFEDGWTSNKFGSVSDADGLINNLDTNHDGVVTPTEVKSVFPTYDVSKNGNMELDELIAQTTKQNDWNRTTPGEIRSCVIYVMFVKFVEYIKYAPPLVSGSSEPQREALLFNAADLDHDGQLTEADLKQIFLDFDSDHNGNVTEDEFRVDWTSVFHLGNAEEAKTLFDRADIDEDGVITSQDLPGIYSFFDMNGDGMVDMNEFLTQWGDLSLNAPDTVVITPETP
ncbi:hypothetical protein BaRGS_00003670, partial [Batillaria attramentaria]